MSRSGFVANLHLNARFCIYTEPFWAVFGTAALYYATLYMSAVGLSPVAIGTIITVNLCVALVFQLAAGALTDRLGRRRATFCFDVTSWVVPMLVWAVSGNFWMFLLGYLLNASSKVVNVSFWLLAAEDSPERDRPRIFAAIKVVIMFAGLLVPVVGWLMSVFGTVPTLRALFFVGGLAMALDNFLRNALVATCAGWVLFLVLGPGNLALLLVCAILTSAGPFLVESYREARARSLPAGRAAARADPAAVLAFEDSARGVRAAKAAGARCVAVPHVLSRSHDFTAADVRFDSMVLCDLDALLPSLP